MQPPFYQHIAMLYFSVLGMIVQLGNLLPYYSFYLLWKCLHFPFNIYIIYLKSFAKSSYLIIPDKRTVLGFLLLHSTNSTDPIYFFLPSEVLWVSVRCCSVTSILMKSPMIMSKFQILQLDVQHEHAFFELMRYYLSVQTTMFSVEKVSFCNIIPSRQHIRAILLPETENFCVASSRSD